MNSNKINWIRRGNQAINLEQVLMITGRHANPVIKFVPIRDYTSSIEWTYETKKERDLDFEKITRLFFMDIDSIVV